jgi:translation initiation factor 2 subunit 3
MDKLKQSVLNIGTLGHIDHGKTSLVKALTNVWTDRHSESLKRNMTIKLGYADTVIRKCEGCEGPEAYTVADKCPECGGEARPLMRISILDAPGHETLMATAIAGANIINAILFVIAANEPCPMQQTKEHLMVINLLGIKDAIVVQSKVDIVGKEGALKHYRQIKEFLKGSVIENAPIIPIMTNQGINVDVLLERIANLPKPKHDPEAEPFMYVARSFDVNKPGAKIGSLKGGVVGGTLVRGELKKGDEVEIRPGIKVGAHKREVYRPIITTIDAISNGAEELDEALPGGLIGLSTEIDPTFTKADGLVGNVVGRKGKLPEVLNSVAITYHSLARTDLQERGFSDNEPIILSVGTLTVVGYVEQAKKNALKIELRHPICAEKGIKMAIMRNIGQRWKLTGWATMA